MKKIVKKNTEAIRRYKKKNSSKAKIINSAVARGLKQYAETFRRLSGA